MQLWQDHTLGKSQKNKIEHKNCSKAIAKRQHRFKIALEILNIKLLYVKHWVMRDRAKFSNSSDKKAFRRLTVAWEQEESGPENFLLHVRGYFIFIPDFTSRLSINVHIFIWQWVTAALNSTFKKERQHQFQHVLNNLTVTFKVVDQQVSLGPNTVWGRELLLSSGALMWSCTERSDAPSPAASTTVSCDVWAEAGATGVQEAPAPLCSPSSSPVLRITSKKEKLKTKTLLNVSHSSLLLLLPSSSRSMKSILWETSSWTASMWSSRLICLCWCCLQLLSTTSGFLPSSSFISVWNLEPLIKA